MKRREYGVNLDDGVALSSDEEFGLLYVPCNPNVTACLQGWFTDDSQESLMLGGQIGSGKTTLINEVSRSFIDAQVITVRFDTEPIEQSEGGYCMLLFGQILQVCLHSRVNIDDCGIDLLDFPSLEVNSWAAFAKKNNKLASKFTRGGTFAGCLCCYDSKRSTCS